MDNLISKVVMGLPFLSDKEIEMAWKAGQAREYQNLEDEMQALRWWYLSEMLLGALITRNGLDPQVAVLVVSGFLKQLDEHVKHLKVDIKQRLKDYNQALQTGMRDVPRAVLSKENLLILEELIMAGGSTGLMVERGESGASRAPRDTLGRRRNPASKPKPFSR